MKLIVKGKEPLEWKKFRRTPGTDYESKPELRKALYSEQGGLCAYCMRRLSDEFNRDILTQNKIDHIKPRDFCTRDERMSYDNMVLCCNGTIQGTSENDTHCDTHKGSTIHQISPLRLCCIDSLSYTSRGKIKSSNITWDKELNEVLNLNQKLLIENRKSFLMKIINWLSKNPSVAQINNKIEFYQSKNESGLYPEYCEVAVWRLKKSLRSRH